LLSWWNLLLCIGGDFNITCFPSERLDESRFSHATMDFSNFISKQGLMDLLLVGESFTIKVSHTAKRLLTCEVYKLWTSLLFQGVF
jgi:hypothetical protein